MMRCDENLIRNDLTALERAEETAKKKRLYDALHPETAHGAIGGGHGRVAESATLDRFTEVLGLNVWRGIQIGNGAGHFKNPIMGASRQT